MLKLGANNVLPTNTDFSITQAASTLSTATLDLNGKNQTLGSLGSDVNCGHEQWSHIEHLDLGWQQQDKVLQR